MSAYNQEKETADWGIVSLRGGFSLTESLDVNFGVDNALDKVYQNHLGGYNRVRGGDLALGQRLVAKGRNLYVSVNASWSSCHRHSGQTQRGPRFIFGRPKKDPGASPGSRVTQQIREAGSK